jgi:hypothetical protein
MDPMTRRMAVEGRDTPARWQDHPEVGTVIVSPEFFGAVGLEIVRGRALSAHDGLPAPRPSS